MEKTLNVISINYSIKTQVQRRALAGEIFGEIGVLCHRPQPFTARTNQLSQVLRLTRTSLMNIMQTNMEEGYMVMKNFLQVNFTL